jgi:hypothetical protein
MRRLIGLLGLVVYEMLVIVAALYLFGTQRAPQPQRESPPIRRVRASDLQPPFCMCHHKTSPHTNESNACDSGAGRACHPEAHRADSRPRPYSFGPGLSR